MRRILAAALLLLACTAPSYAQSPVQSGMLEFGGKALDCANGVLTLDAPTGSITQQWGLWGPPSGNSIWLLQCNGWQAIDFTKNPLIVGQVWDNPASGDSMAIVAATPTSPMQITAQGEVLEPDPTDTTVVLTQPSAGWSWVQPPPPSGGGGSGGGGGGGNGAPTPSAWVPQGYIYQAAASDEFLPGDDITQKFWTRFGCSNSGGTPCDGTQQLIPSNGEQQLYEESNNHVVATSGQGIQLVAYAPTSSKSYYSSGMLRDKMDLNFGSPNTGFYIEISAKIPSSYGAWPAFWFGPDPVTVNVPPWPPEIDAAEFMVQNPNQGVVSTDQDVHMSVKFNGNMPGPWNGSAIGWDSANQPSGWQWCSQACYGDTQWDTTENLSAAFHTYGFQITPGVAGVDPVNPLTGLPTHRYKMFIDGWEALWGNYDFQMGADGSSGWNAALLLNLAVGGVGGGTPDPTTFPAYYDIQYVRVYTSQNDPAALVPSVIGQNFCPAGGVGC